MFVCFPAFWKLRHHIFIQARGASMCTLTAKAACFCWAITPVPTLNCTSSYTSPGSSAKLNSLKCVCCFYCAPQTARSHTIQIFLPGSIFFPSPGPGYPLPVCNLARGQQLLFVTPKDATVSVLPMCTST